MRERDRYGHQSVAERLGAAWEWFRDRRTVQIVVGAVVIGLAALLLLTPRMLRFDDLTTGDCLFIRSPSALDLDPENTIGDPSTLSAILLAEGAEQTGCEGNHGHEVIAVERLADPTGTPYPGRGALEDRYGSTCDAAFEPYVGHPAGGSAYVAFVVVPDDVRWAEGSRTVACLIQREDGRFMDHPARGSGE
jgi:hypothetical protein